MRGLDYMHMRIYLQRVCHYLWLLRQCKQDSASIDSIGSEQEHSLYQVPREHKSRA